MSWLADLWRYGFTAKQRHASRAAERYAEAIRAYERELAQVPLTEARARAEGVLAAATQVRVTPADQSAAMQLGHLAPGQQDVFGRARRVQALNGEPYVDAAEVKPYEWDNRLVQLGLDSEHAYIVARPGEEAVFVVDETEELNLERAQRFPSLYHWILWLNRSSELLHELDEPAA